MVLFGLLLLICYIPGVTGFSLATGWLLLSAMLPWILRERLLHVNPFLIWAAVGLTWTPIWQQGVFDLWRLCILTGAFLLGQSEVEPRRLYKGMAVGLIASTVVAIIQFSGWEPLPQIYPAPSGLFVNPNIFGEIAALIIIACAACELWAWAIVSLPAVILSQSRTAILALGATAVAWLWNRGQFRSVLVAAIAAAMLIGYFTFQDKFSYNGLAKPIENLWKRVAIWQNTIDGFTRLGRGPGSFVITYPAFSSRTDVMASREEDAHNDWLQLWYQYGLGCLLLAPVLLVGFGGTLGPERYLFLGFAIIACFSFPLAVPVEGFIGAFSLGRMWRNRDVVFWNWLAGGWPFRGRLGVPQSGHG